MANIDIKISWEWIKDYNIIREYNVVIKDWQIPYRFNLG